MYSQVNRTGYYSTHNLMTYINVGNEKGVESLLKSGASANHHGYSVTALMFACLNGKFGCAQFLLEYGADVNVVSKVDGKTSLIRASAKGDLNCVNLLLTCNALVNAQDRFGNSALMLASLSGHIACVKRLLENNPDVNLQNQWNGTALSYALKNGHIEIAILLLKHGARVTVEALKALANVINLASCSHLRFHMYLSLQKTSQPLKPWCEYLRLHQYRPNQTLSTNPIAPDTMKPWQRWVKENQYRPKPGV